MIVKSVRHSTYRFDTLVNYVLDGMDTKLDENRWVLFHNLQNGHQRQDIIKEFEANAEFLKKRITTRRRCYKYHEILAFTKESSKHLTNEKLQEIGRDYLSVRDPEKACKALIVAHWELSHVHLHLILSSNFIGSEKSSDMRMDNKTYYEVRRSIERSTLEKFPELVQSTVYLEPEEVRKIVPLKYHEQIRTKPKKSKDFGKQTKKQLISNQVQEILDKSSSLIDFQNRLENDKNLQPYFRRERLQGVIVDNKKYRLKTLGIEHLPEKLHVLSRLNELEQISKSKQRDYDLER